MNKVKLKNGSDAVLHQSVLTPIGEDSTEIENFNFDILVNTFHRILETLPDKRKGKNKTKSIKDAVLCAFSVFYTQCPSFLSYQRTMQKKRGKNNSASLFGTQEILSDSQIRRLLDAIPPSFVFPMFWTVFAVLNDNGYLSSFGSYNNNLLLALDGTRYFSSSVIHCDSCSLTHNKNGSITYSHSAITPVIINPQSPYVISLPPEFITPQDGHEKQIARMQALSAG